MLRFITGELVMSDILVEIAKCSVHFSLHWRAFPIQLPSQQHNPDPSTTLSKLRVAYCLCCTPMCDSVVCKYGTITWDRAGQIINVNKKENWAENSPLWNTGLRALGCWQTSIYPNKECTHLWGNSNSKRSESTQVRCCWSSSLQGETLAMAQIPFLSLVFHNP